MPFDRRASPVHDFLYQRGCWFGNKSGMAMYSRWVAAGAAADPGFPDALRIVALDVLNEEGDEGLIGNALQALAEVGRVEDIEIVGRFTGHPDSRIVKNATTCSFAIRQRARHRDPLA